MQAAGRLEGAVLDLSVSPDVSAYFCYAIVLLAGIAVAVAEIQSRLGTTEGAWFIPGTLFLFGAYVLVPVALFWLLDRTGAINDTSVFAALLIGFGYQRIITGGNQTIRAPGDVSALWTPFVAYADKVAKAAIERSARNQRRLAEQIISEIMRDQNRYNALQALALTRTSDVATVKAALQAIDNAPESGEADKLEKKTRYLYGLLLSVPDIDYLLKSKNIVSPNFYWVYIKRFRQLATIFLIVIAIGGALTSVVVTSYPNYREIAATYHVWRLGKTNSSSIDQYRSRRDLVTIMADDRAVMREARDDLIYLMQRPGLPMERVDLLLQTLLETHPRAANNDLPRSLLQALRGASLDARTRVHDALVFLSAPCSGKLDTALKDWKPTERDSSTALEEKITAWNSYWATGCLPK